MIELDEQTQPNAFQDAMTPMIDVIFVLIAFMMLMINIPRLTMEVQLPKTSTTQVSSQVKKQVVTLALKPDDAKWYMDKQSYSSKPAFVAALTALKQQYGEEMSVVIHSDQSVPMQRAVELFSILQGLDLNVTHLALSQGES